MRVIDRLDKYMVNSGLNDNQITVNCGLSVGLLGKARQGKSDIGKKAIDKILNYYQDINYVWLLTGDGEMLKGDSSASVATVGVPYFDVDFMNGFDVLTNDQTVNPSQYINFPQYSKADCWVNATGRSMEPLINHGDMVAIRRIEDWHTYILYGEVYAIVTDEYRTIKYVRKSPKGADCVRLVPLNITEYDEQDIELSTIRFVYQVLGCAKKIF